MRTPSAMLLVGKALKLALHLCFRRGQSIGKYADGASRENRDPRARLVPHREGGGREDSRDERRHESNYHCDWVLSPVIFGFCEGYGNHLVPTLSIYGL
jgi:hypothetical protein